MKSLLLILIYLFAFMGMYLMLSCIGFLWVADYKEIISEPGWFMVYMIFLGSWMAWLPTYEYYKANETHFDRVYN